MGAAWEKKRERERENLPFCYPDWSQGKWPSARQPALSRHLGELGTVSRSSHVWGRFSSENKCTLGLFPPTRRGNSKNCCRKNQTRFSKPSSSFSVFKHRGRSCFLVWTHRGKEGLLLDSTGSAQGLLTPSLSLGPLLLASMSLWLSSWLEQVRLVCLISTCKSTWLVWTMCGRWGQQGTRLCQIRSETEVHLVMVGHVGKPFGLGWGLLSQPDAKQPSFLRISAPVNHLWSHRA